MTTININFWQLLAPISSRLYANHWKKIFEVFFKDCMTSSISQLAISILSTIKNKSAKNTLIKKVPRFELFRTPKTISRH